MNAIVVSTFLIAQPTDRGVIFKRDNKGRISEELNYTKDTLNGEFKRYYANGKVFSRGFILDGEPHGHWYQYDRKGNMQLHLYYQNGTRTLYESFWANGNTRLKAMFANGLMDGEMKTYYRNGKIETTVIYRRGAILSALRKYSKRGNLILLMLPVSTTRDRFITKEEFGKHGRTIKTRSINELPISYYLFGPDVLRADPLDGNEAGGE